MVQNPLWETSDNVYPNFVRVEDDLGPVGKGVSGARYVSAENGTEYLIKGPSLKLKSTGHPEHPHVAANELIAAGLARLLGLPTLDSRIVEMRGQLFFASVWMPAGTFYDPITAELFNGCANRDRTYGLVVFDAWLCNTDRHGGNLLVRRAGIPDNGGERLSLLLNDHSHCLVLPGKTVEALVARLDSGPQDYCFLPYVRGSIQVLRQLQAAIAAAEAVTRRDLETVVHSVPDPLMPAGDRDPIFQFLLDRQERLRRVISDGRAWFPNLEDGSL